MPGDAASVPLMMGTQDTAITVVIAVLCLIIVGMIVAIAGVYLKRRVRKSGLDQRVAATFANLENSIKNPMYGGNDSILLCSFIS